MWLFLAASRMIGFLAASPQMPTSLSLAVLSSITERIAALKMPAPSAVNFSDWSRAPLGHSLWQ